LPWLHMYFTSLMTNLSIQLCHVYQITSIRVPWFFDLECDPNQESWETNFLGLDWLLLGWDQTNTVSYTLCSHTLVLWLVHFPKCQCILYKVIYEGNQIDFRGNESITKSAWLCSGVSISAHEYIT
jgi:hypothetical protein